MCQTQQDAAQKILSKILLVEEETDEKNETDTSQQADE